jgi:hypothetical protein
MTNHDNPAASVIDIGRARASRPKSLAFHGPGWLKNAVCDDKGRPLPILRNVALALRSVPEIAERFATFLNLTKSHSSQMFSICYRICSDGASIGSPSKFNCTI